MTKHLEHVEQNVNYKVGSGMVNLKVTIGEGQLGNATGLLNSKLLFIGSTVDMSIGKSEDIKGKTLNIDASIKDIRPDIDDTILTVELNDDSNAIVIPSEGKAKQNGGTVIHEINIHLS